MVLPLKATSSELDLCVDSIASFIEDKGISVENVAQPYYQIPF
jgi:hypothetical protein